MGWTPIQVLSSDESTFYTVFCNSWASPNEFICECRGYQYRGHCRHQHVAADKLCGWDSESGSEQQSDTERITQTCPRCGGPTRWEITESNDST